MKSSPACPGDHTRDRGRSQRTGSAPSRGGRGARVPAQPGRPSPPPSVPPGPGSQGWATESVASRGISLWPRGCWSLVLRTWLCWGCASSQGRVSGGSSRGRPASSAWHTRDWSVRSPCSQASPAPGFPAPAARKSNTTAAGKVTELAEQESTRPARPAPCTVCKQNLYNDASQSCRPCGLQSASQRIR